MTIEFKDFAPAATEHRALIFSSRTIDTFQSALDEANAWIDRNSIEVLNIETVVLPEMHSEEGTTDTDLTTSGEMMSSWYQFIRVWYKAE